MANVVKHNSPYHFRKGCEYRLKIKREREFTTASTIYLHSITITQLCHFAMCVLCI